MSEQLLTNPADMLAAIADEVRGGCANYSGIALSTRLDDIVERIRLSATASEKQAARYAVLRENTTPKELANQLGIKWTDIPKEQSISEKIDELCDQAIQGGYEHAG